VSSRNGFRIPVARFLKRGTVAQPPGLAGRADEQAALRGLLLSLGDGMSGALVLRGEPGIGKTALLEHLAGTAPDIDFAVVPGVESEAGSVSPGCTGC